MSRPVVKCLGVAAEKRAHLSCREQSGNRIKFLENCLKLAGRQARRYARHYNLMSALFCRMLGGLAGGAP